MSNGIVNKTWLETSGGVIIADKTNVITIACFLYFRIKSGVRRPSFDKKYTIKGS